MKAGSFEHLAHDLRELARLASGRSAQPTAVILEGRTLQSSPESGGRASYDGYKRRKGSKVHIAVDTLGHLLAVKVTAASEQKRAQVGELTDTAAWQHRSENLVTARVRSPDAPNTTTHNAATPR